MVLAIEACHKLGFIHRDIKPDVRHYRTRSPIRLTRDTARISCLTLKAILN